MLTTLFIDNVIEIFFSLDVPTMISFSRTCRATRLLMKEKVDYHKTMDICLDEGYFSLLFELKLSNDDKVYDFIDKALEKGYCQEFGKILAEGRFVLKPELYHTAIRKGSFLMFEFLKEFHCPCYGNITLIGYYMDEMFFLDEFIKESNIEIFNWFKANSDEINWNNYTNDCSPWPIYRGNISGLVAVRGNWGWGDMPFNPPVTNVTHDFDMHEFPEFVSSM